VADPNIPNLEPRVAVLEQIALDTQRALDRIEKRLNVFEERIDRRLETLDRRQHTDFLWMLAIMLGGYAGMLASMAHGFKWI